MELKFYRCNHCGNIIAKVKDSGVNVVCCGDEMERLWPGTSDGAAEKHVPVYLVKELKPGDKPIVEFALSEGEKIEAVYEYCNLHGLWKAE